MDKNLQPLTELNNQNPSLHNCVECSDEENIAESFTCCVCLDLLYKPIVLGCGHISCFWCVHLSMDSFSGSRCPICRNPYHHFSTICQILHFLIIKMYPVAYQRRHNQMLEEEQRTECFSPQFEGSSLNSNSLGGSAILSVPCLKSSLSSESSKLETPECLQDGKIAVGEENNLSRTNSNGTLNQISTSDVLCPTCKELLFRPAVLNCGHAYCETCITVLEDESIICPVCERAHPSSFPKVCLELNKFLEETFPKEYASRRDSVEREQTEFQQKSTPTCSSSKKYDSKFSWLSAISSGDMLRRGTEGGLEVHVGAGCDHCGIIPIIGNRYKCKDCKEAMGFDLCEKCYNTQSKLPGRFNQQHTAEHKFELCKTRYHYARQILVSDPLHDGSAVLSTEVSQDSDDGADFVMFADSDADSNPEDSTLSNNTMGDENDNIQFHP